MNSDYEKMYKDLLYVLGYIVGKSENDVTPFEGTEEETIRRCLGLVSEKIKNEN